ncbi:pyridoxal phosphate-dependent decarboxylase family protein [Thaumasiovibrio subtropicus]|uniref:pyridoxal phosphate-dependent decarboxylase family protein n=1 Tax=Thaumasiovibrio subtropicus TaxID=1891207 RepID=UPI000B34F43F|nr:pyridoxal-dependent decarboxylase [Thaumasiovibrio subtropicus]
MSNSCLSLLQNKEANQLNSAFERYYNEAFADYFSRDPNKWPVFNEPGFAAIHNFRQQRLSPHERIAGYPNGEALHAQLVGDASLSQGRMRPSGQPDEMLAFAAALSKDWENPSSVENVVTMPADPAIYGSMMGAMANPNLAYSEYAGMADQLEKHVIRQIATHVGYDPEQSTGLFTQGGTFCNLYGYLLGLRKSLPTAIHHGMQSVPDYRIINSQGGHYSNMTNLSLLGVDIKEKTIRIKVTDSHDIDFDDLERQMRACFAVKCLIPTIMITMGTTDTFAVDKIKPVYDLRERLCEEYQVPVKPHLHVDAAVGWSMIFFLDYDFKRNPLAINEVTLAGIERTVARVRELKYADSFTVDFHKWGYVPYTSSLVMIKNKDDMKALENEPENFSYFEHDLQGQTHLQSTIECSRGAVGVFGAYAAMKYMGIEGYQIILAHCLQNANYFRSQLLELGNVKLMVPENQGPSVGFRLYNPEWVNDVNAEFANEQQCMSNEAYMAMLARNSKWHRQIFKQRGKVGLYTNWVEFISRSAYNPYGKYSYIPGEKAVFMNPATGRTQIDTFVSRLMG